MNKNIFITIIIVVLIVGIYAVLWFSSPFENIGTFIFSTIDECEDLIINESSDVSIIRYDESTKDKNSKGLLYKEFFGMSYKSDELEYEIFAYEFEDNDDALKYYINVTKQHSFEKELPLDDADENKHLLGSIGMFSYDLVVTYENKAYRIIAPKRYAKKLDNLIAETFSNKIL